VAVPTLVVDPDVKSWVFGIVLLAGERTMAVLSLESLQLVELGIPGCFVKIPDKANRVQLLSTVS
jgi:hypothetical protein